MRTRLAILLALVLLIPALGAALSPVSAAGNLTLAQDTGGDSVDGAEDGGVGEGEEGENPGTGEDDGQGSSDPEAETGAGEGETTGEEEVEAGPVWTYQMSKIIIALLLLLLLAIAGAYWRFVAQRQRAGV